LDRTVKGATIRDVARAADVSVATVSRTLNGIETVAGPTRDRVLRAAGELDYVPHSGARALSTRRTDTIGVLLPDLHGEFFSELIRGIDLAARARGLHLLLSSSHGDPAEAAAAMRAMRSRVDSIIVMPPNAGEDLPTHAKKGEVPMVFLGGGDHRDHPSFEIDNFAGAFAITEHLAGTGRSRIAFVAGPSDNFEAKERQRGYRAAIEIAGVSEWIVEGDFSEQSGREAAIQFIGRNPPDAIFCANDMMAIGCLEALRDAGVRIPEDIALAGFDDIPIARYVRPPLTTAAVPIAEIGRRALECCVDLIAGRETQQQHIFQPVLAIRSSTMPTNPSTIDRSKGEFR
jgi:LacI family transcriptional regulator